MSHASLTTSPRRRAVMPARSASCKVLIGSSVRTLRMRVRIEGGRLTVTRTLIATIAAGYRPTSPLPQGFSRPDRLWIPRGTPPACRTPEPMLAKRSQGDGETEVPTGADQAPMMGQAIARAFDEQSGELRGLSRDTRYATGDRSPRRCETRQSSCAFGHLWRSPSSGCETASS
jgi:hypothetical protein